MTGAAVMAIALMIDAVFGWPDWLYRRIGHPVGWLGRAINWFDQSLNSSDVSPFRRRALGCLSALVVILGAATIVWILTLPLSNSAAGITLQAILVWPLIATRSLHEHVRAVATPLIKGDLPAARGAVSMIVGRDPTQLDEAGVSRATLESLAENSSDGVVAPVFWGAIFGVPGIAAYKAINTLDSMIGHKTERHLDFGWAAARIDDLANLIPARLTGVLICAVSSRRRASFATMRRDAGHHRSPNAGWPEAAMAGALQVRLSGPRIYENSVADEPWLNHSAPDPTPMNITDGLAIFRRAMIALFLLLVALAAV